jgi:hypothetical protein
MDEESARPSRDRMVVRIVAEAKRYFGWWVGLDGLFE